MAEHKNIYEALVAAQKEFGQVTKGSVNPAFKSRYADLADVANVVIPVLSQHGVAVLHYMVGESLSAMRTEFHHAASDTLVACDVPLIFDRNNMQGMKSATTYAKRIGLESLSGIAPEDDDGNAARQGNPQEPPKTTAPPEWEGWLAKQGHVEQVRLIDAALKAFDYRGGIESIREQVVAAGRPTEKTSFGAARSAIKSIARLAEVTPENVIRAAGGNL